MKAILILAGPFSSCDSTKNIWQDLCAKSNLELETYDLSEVIGKDIAAKHNIKSFPALIVKDKVVAVGHPNKEVARQVFDSLDI